MMPAGRRDKRVTFQNVTETQDQAGGYSTAWGGDVTVYANFRPETGRERLEAGRLEAALGGRLWVLSSAETRAINERHRVLIDDVPYNIRSVGPTIKGEIEMTVEKGVAI